MRCHWTATTISENKHTCVQHTHTGLLWHCTVHFVYVYTITKRWPTKRRIEEKRRAIKLRAQRGKRSGGKKTGRPFCFVAITKNYWLLLVEVLKSRNNNNNSTNQQPKQGNKYIAFIPSCFAFWLAGWHVCIFSEWTDFSSICYKLYNF